MLKEAEIHRNNYLFSDYYLNTVLPQQLAWSEADTEAERVLELIRQLYTDKKDFLQSTVSEPSLEDEWIRPILEILDHNYYVGASLPSPEGSRTPDYALFPDEATKRNALPHLGKAEFYSTALAVADAKRWDRPLDRRLADGAGDAFSRANPSYQIDYYLRITGRHWGLLTNGHLWRLYNRESSYRLDSYYEVDLISLLMQGQTESFKYFYLFFHRNAFSEFLNRVLQESRDYAQGVSERLKEPIYEALRLLAEGFLRYPGTSLTEADIKEIHDNSLILLYRLLFILYAESRGLLPLEVTSYSEVYSLKAVKEDIADKLDRGVQYHPRRATIWDNLKELFHIINDGSAQLSVPAYNGRLFDPSKYSFLEKHNIGDAYLVHALDLLARAEGPQARDFVDYRDLEIRHLGSIYEGLLEYQLHFADRDMTVVKERNAELVVPAENGQDVTYPAGTVYMVTDRGERKATGSYYTPDYIVKYIVENTLESVIDQKQFAIQERITGLEERMKRAKGEDRISLAREIARSRKGFGEGVLELKLLDPAMGSGHFLVEAVDYLAQRIVDFGVTLGAAIESDDQPKEAEISYWRRRVVESCICGVDVNPLAVELAKLSLWLATAAKGKPLSFLDHHLRCGNSLIGARLRELGSLPLRKKGKSVHVEQITLFDESAFSRDMSQAMDGLTTIHDLDSDSVANIHEKERIFQTLLVTHLKKWWHIANLWVSTYFGNELASDVYGDLVLRLQTGKSRIPDSQAQFYLDRTQTLWQEMNFFHWELEFPEVFFDQNGRWQSNPGFDALVGNPPWGGKFSDSEKEYLRRLQTDTKIPNNYVYFQKTAEDLLKSSGMQSFLLPDSLLMKEYPLTRERLVRRRLISQLVFLDNTDLPRHLRPFPDVNHDLVILIIHNNPPEADSSVVVRFVKGIVHDISATHHHHMSQSWFDDEELEYRFNLLLNPLKIRVRERIESVSWKLFEKFESHEGIHSGNIREKLFIPPNTTLHGRMLRPLIMGASHGDIIDRYQLFWAGWHVRYDPALIEPDKNEYASLREERIFLEPKLFVVRTGDTFSLALDRERFYASNNLFCLLPRSKTSEPYKLEFLLALLNGRLLQWYLRTHIAPRIGHLYTETKIKHLNFLPIRHIAFTTRQKERTKLVNEGVELAMNAVNDLAANSGIYNERITYPFAQFIESSLGSWLTACLPIKRDASPDTEKEQSDAVHDILVNLAMQMIAMNKEKQNEAHSFLDWLAGYTDLPVENWALKTSLKAYHKNNWHEMRRVLDHNQRKIKKVDVKGRASSERIKSEWEASMGKLRPLMTRIAATDRLIDLIVYRLYGLTEEQIAIVEGEV